MSAAPAEDLYQALRIYDDADKIAVLADRAENSGGAGFIGAAVYLNGAATLGSGDRIPWVNVDFGSADFLDGDNSQIVFPAGSDGVYEVTLAIAGSYTTGEAFIAPQTFTSGAPFNFPVPASFQNSSDWCANGSYIGVFAEGDHIYASIAFGINPTIHVSSTGTEFMVRKVADTP